jgi:molecular chaperone DnaK
MAADNKSLGQFELLGIAPAPRGVPKIEVTFDIDANGIVNVSARDVGTGMQQAIRVTASGGLVPDEIARMRAEAERHTAEDARKKELAEVRNEAESLIYTTERAIAEFSSLLDDAEASMLHDSLAAVRGALGGGDVGALRSSVKALAEAGGILSRLIYRNADATDPFKTDPARSRALGGDVPRPR